MLAQLKPNPIRRGASENIINSLQSMGYENINSDSAFYNLEYHIQAPDQKQHVLLHRTPFMLDDQTTKTNIALAQKSLRALGDDQKVATIDEVVVYSKRNDIEKIVQALNEAGVASLNENQPAAETPSPATDASETVWNWHKKWS